jgi:glycosyltransferase involved in cell wall biosynthesis
MNDLVSIIMPVYNGAPFLERSIKSVLNQTFNNWELIIIDDDSNDNSLQVIQEFLPNKNIILLSNNSNKGIAATRNVGLKNASGLYIALLDQDDEWLPTKLEKQIQLFKSSSVDYALVYTNTKVQLNNGILINKKINIEPGPSIQENLIKLFQSNFISSLTVLIKKEYLDEVGFFNEDIRWGGDDYELWLRLATKYKFGFINETLTIRHEHGGNFSAPKKKIMTGTIKLAENFAEEHAFLKDYLKKNKATQFYRFGIESFKSNNIRQGFYYVLRSFFFDRIAFKLFSLTIKHALFGR